MTRHRRPTRLTPGLPGRPNLGIPTLLCFLLAGLTAGGSPAPARAAATRLAPLSGHMVQVTPGRWIEVRGERNHQQRSYRRLPATWSADQKAGAAAYGFPVFRLRELSAGVQTETWTYPDADVQLVFDASGKLLATRLP